MVLCFQGVSTLALARPSSSGLFFRRTRRRCRRHRFNLLGERRIRYPESRRVRRDIGDVTTRLVHKDARPFGRKIRNDLLTGRRVDHRLGLGLEARGDVFGDCGHGGQPYWSARTKASGRGEVFRRGPGECCRVIAMAEHELLGLGH
jgi:hypothetical protein